MEKFAVEVETSPDCYQIIFCCEDEYQRIMSDLENDESEYYSISRNPEFDQYSSLGYVPARDLIHKYYWRYYCCQCEKEFGDDEWDEDENQPLNPVYDKEWAYCSHECFDKENKIK